MKMSPTAEDLAAQAQPLPTGAKLTVGIEDIALPPAHIAEEMLRDEPEAEPDGPAPEVATLDFFGDALPTWTRTLTYPFRWEGRPHTAITVTQLTTAQVGDVHRRVRAARQPGATEREPDLYDVYALMTRLPARVLRALPAEDGDPVTDKCFSFLPPSLRPEPE